FVGFPKDFLVFIFFFRVISSQEMQPYTFVLVPTGRTSVSSKLLETHIPHKHYELVEQCKAGNPGSQYRLYSQYVDAMYNVGLRLLGNTEDAEDIVQESFVQAFQNL